MIKNIGYACINTELKKRGITTNRGCIKRTFQSKGLRYVGELALQNIHDLSTILQWNAEQGIRLFRVSSDIIPWHSEYSIEQLPQFKEIEAISKHVGTFAREHGIRITTHPGQ